MDLCHFTSPDIVSNGGKIRKFKLRPSSEFLFSIEKSNCLTNIFLSVIWLGISIITWNHQTAKFDLASEFMVFVIFRYRQGPFTFPAFCFESCTALALNHFCHLLSAYERMAFAYTYGKSKSDFWFQSHSWWTDIGSNNLPYFIITAVCASFISFWKLFSPF